LSDAQEQVPHHPFLQHHFDDLGQQQEASTLGMWVFLVTEVLFFGPIFFAFTLYRNKYLQAFTIASHHQNWKLGTTNTAVLILSSLTVVMGVYFAQTNRRRALCLSIIATLGLGLVFLGIKAIEYHEHYVEGFFPGSHFGYSGPMANQVEMFFVLYFILTGIHAFHMIIGIGLFTRLLYRAQRGDFDAEYYGPVEVLGLYWHFVDIVWIFLFPMLYLIGRHAH
jgi:cytochrome c oxidase subunit 3